MRIAFLGLGTMGAPMATNLLRAGHQLVVWNRTHERTEPLRDQGADVARSPRDAARSCELILTMLADEHALDAVLRGEDGLLAGLIPGALVVEMSTIGKAAALDAAAQIGARGGAFVDAPVSGTRGPAIAGKLLILAGGASQDIARAAPVLAAIGTVRHIGAIGDGAAMKLVLNALGAQLLVGLAGTLGLAKHMGLDPAAALDLIQAGPFASPLFALKRERLLGDAPGADPDFTIDLWDKDQRLVLEEAARLRYAMPMVETVRSLLAQAIASGRGGEDIAAIGKLFAR